MSYTTALPRNIGLYSAYGGNLPFSMEDISSTIGKFDNVGKKMVEQGYLDPYSLRRLHAAHFTSGKISALGNESPDLFLDSNDLSRMKGVMQVRNFLDGIEARRQGLHLDDPKTTYLLGEHIMQNGGDPLKALIQEDPVRQGRFMMDPKFMQSQLLKRLNPLPPDPTIPLEHQVNQPLPSDEEIPNTPEFKAGDALMGFRRLPITPHVASTYNHMLESMGAAYKNFKEAKLSKILSTLAANPSEGGKTFNKSIMLKSQLYKINDLISFNKERALENIVDFAKSNPDIYYDIRMTPKDFEEIGYLLDYVDLIQNQAVSRETLQKAWTMTEPVPLDVNALPAKPYKEEDVTGSTEDRYGKPERKFKKYQFSPGPNEEPIENTFTRTFVSNPPDSEFIDVMIMRTYIDKYLQEKRSEEDVE